MKKKRNKKHIKTKCGYLWDRGSGGVRKEGENYFIIK